jgi:hypothetical protein
MMLTDEREKGKRCCQLNRCAPGTGGRHNREGKTKSSNMAPRWVHRETKTGHRA